MQKLLDKQIQAYSPVVKRLQQWSDRKKWVEFPMISGYVFIKLDLSEKEKVLMNPAVLGFVKFSGKEAVVKESEIETLKSIELTGFDVTMESGIFHLNDKVEITQGHLKGLEGMITMIQNEEYVQMELESIRQSIKVKIPKHILKLKKGLSLIMPILLSALSII